MFYDTTADCLALLKIAFNSIMPTIPTLHLKDFTEGDAAQRAAFIENLGKAYSDIGFVAVTGHGLAEADREKLYQAVEKIFSLPEKTKQQYEVPGLGGQRGYTSKGKEHAKGRSVGDLKEFYQVGQTVVGEELPKDVYPDNVWPQEVPEFEAATQHAYRTLEHAGREILRAIALYLELPEDYFDAKIHNGNSILRAIHYFPLDPEAIDPEAVRSAAHEDINLITLLMGASAEGLQVQTREGEWVAITAVPEAVVVNVGDMLQRLTNNKLRSTTHRVVNPPREKMNTSRYSIPFFLHPRAEMDLTCLDSCVSEETPRQYRDMTAGEYLEERLREIGLKA